MAGHSVAGMRIFVGGVMSPPLTTLVAADFAAQTWVEIQNWFRIGDLSEDASVATRSNPGPVRHRVKTGEVQVEDIEIIAEHEPTDPGQAILIAASDPDYQDSHAFCIHDSDAAPNPSKRFLVGCVVGRAELAGKADDPRRTRFKIAVNSNVVHVVAS